MRDLSLFLGAAAELPTTSMGPGLPGVREWAQDWFEMVPYVVPFDPRDYRDTAALRTRLGYPLDVPLLAAAVGGTAVGRPTAGPRRRGLRAPAQGECRTPGW